jgi:hypothetical protein
MARKPALTLVEPGATGAQPPPTLGKSGATLWRTLTSHYRFDDVGGLEMLTQRPQTKKVPTVPHPR